MILIYLLNQGGLERITVFDNGHGMPPEDVECCVERHATSKIRSAEDLEQLRSFGFRGEALSSIAAVSRMTVTSRLEAAEEGYRVCVENGDIIERGAVGAPCGTTIDVQGLFSCVPARRKFIAGTRYRAESHHRHRVARIVAGLFRCDGASNANAATDSDCEE